MMPQPRRPLKTAILGRDLQTRRLALAAALFAGLTACSGSDAPAEDPTPRVTVASSDCVDGGELRHRQDAAQTHIDAAFKALKSTDYAKMYDHLRLGAHFLREMGGTAAQAAYPAAKDFFRAADHFDNAAVTVNSSTTPTSIEKATSYARDGVDAEEEGLDLISPTALCSGT
jgi:hypothetical protein